MLWCVGRVEIVHTLSDVLLADNFPVLQSRLD